MPVLLDTLPAGARARVVQVNAGPRLSMRLFEMGIVPGSVVEVVANNRGPILIRVRGVTLAIGRGMAKKILVEPF